MSSIDDGSAAALAGELQRLERALLRLPAVLVDQDPARVIAVLTDIARDVTGAAFGLYSPHVSDDAIEEIIVGVENGELTDRPEVRRAPLLAASFQNTEVLRVDDVAQWAPSEDAAKPYGSWTDGRLVRSYLTASVRSRSGDVLGALILGHPDARAFSARHERLVASMSEQLAAALENAHRYREQTSIAVALQETLLPPILPAVPGAEVAARYRPTGAGNLVGGDFYDVFPIAPDHWAVVLGDVSGVGPEAAALTGIARYTVRAVAGQREPASVLTALNEALLNQQVTDRFCSAVYLTVTQHDRGLLVRLANAGHPPALVLRDNGAAVAVDSPGMLLGLYADAPIGECEIRLAPGDALILYTDGVVEARDASGDQLGYERLVDILERCAGRTADGITRHVELAAIDFQDGSTLDDVAVVVVPAVPVPVPHPNL